MSTNPEKTLSLPEQVIYKLGELSAEVSSGFKRLDQRMDAFQKDRDASEKKIDVVEDRVAALETWKNALVAKYSLIAASLAIVWGIVAAPISRLIFGTH